MLIDLVYSKFVFSIVFLYKKLSDKMSCFASFWEKIFLNELCPLSLIIDFISFLVFTFHDKIIHIHKQLPIISFQTFFHINFVRKTWSDLIYFLLHALIPFQQLLYS